MEKPPQPEPTAPPAVVASGKPKQARRRKPDPTKMQARSMFNASAPPIPVGEVFKDFTWTEDHNVDVVLDLDSIDRIAEPYMKPARDFGTYKLRIDPAPPAEGTIDRRKDTQATVYAMIALSFARKLVSAVPNSEVNEVGTFKYIAKEEFLAPQSIVNAVEHLGKFELDDKKARIKYNSQDVARTLIKACKVMSLHSDFQGRYDVPGHIRLGNDTDTNWADVDPDSYVIASQSSVRWMHDEGWKAYDSIAAIPFRAHIPTANNQEFVEVSVGYPQLKRSKNMDKQLRNVLDWLPTLSTAMPNYARITAAAFATCWKKIWFERPTVPINRLQSDVPGNFVATPNTLMALLGVRLWDIELERTQPTTAAFFARRIYDHVVNSSYLFAGFVNLVKQPQSQFGSPAQLIVYDKQDFFVEQIVGLEEVSVKKLKRGASARVITQNGDRGAIAAGMMFAFAKEVKFNAIFDTNGENLSNQLQRYFSGDVKHFF